MSPLAKFALLISGSAFLLFLCAVMSGCAALEPDVSVDAVHVSHASQHMGPAPTNYGYDSAQLALHWESKRFGLTLADGIVLERCHAVGPSNPECGALVGPREVFEARGSFYLWRRHE